MAKKSKDSEYVLVQKLANKSAKDIQKLVNKANKQTLEFNAQEAKTQREFNKQEASTAREFNAAEAEKSREWQEKMSNTAHQREVADLKKAGLNPVLSANSGAQSYTSSSASASPASGSAASGSVESGASAMASIMGTLMNSMAGLRSTQMNNEAQLRATQISASAARYAADKNYAASTYAADKAYQTQMDKPQTSAAALVDKYLGKYIRENGEEIFNKAKEGIDYVFNKDNGLVVKTAKLGKGIKDLYTKMKVDPTVTTYWDKTLKHQNTFKSSASLMFRAVYLGQFDAIKELQYMISLYKKSHPGYREKGTV